MWVAVKPLLSSLVALLALGLGPLNHDSGGDYGNGNDQRRCHNGQNCRGSFSPGPFEDSPVDAFNGNCLPGATCYYDGRQGQEPS